MVKPIIIVVHFIIYLFIHHLFHSKAYANLDVEALMDIEPHRRTTQPNKKTNLRFLTQISHHTIDHEPHLNNNQQPKENPINKTLNQISQIKTIKGKILTLLEFYASSTFNLTHGRHHTLFWCISTVAPWIPAATSARFMGLSLSLSLSFSLSFSILIYLKLGEFQRQLWLEGWGWFTGWFTRVRKK